jgi:PHP family Zn ribbon phosphoesterase
MSAEESLREAEELMERLEETRRRLEETTDPEVAIEVLSELAEIAREIEAALSRAKREADAGG